jgi:GYF domain 2
MYHFIGSDGLEYGPVDADTIRRWIQEGRLNGQTKTRAAGQTGFRPLEEFPELNGSPAAKTEAAAPAGGAQPSQSPVTPAAREPDHDPEALIARANARAARMSATQAFGKGWETFTANFWSILGAGVLFIVINTLLGSTGVGLVVSGPLIGGLFLYLLKSIRSRNATAGDLFEGFSGAAFPSLVIVGLLFYVFTFIGFIACVLPALYVICVYHLAFPLAIDKKLGFWEAMEVSRRVSHADLWTFFALFLLSILAAFAGTLALGVGIFITTTWTFLAYAQKYESLFGDDTAS